MVKSKSEATPVAAAAAPAVTKPAAPKKAAAPKKVGGRRKKSNYSSFSTYIYKVLKQVHPGIYL